MCLERLDGKPHRSGAAMKRKERMKQTHRGKREMRNLIGPDRGKRTHVRK